MQVKEDDLREVLSPAGFVWEVTVLRSPDGADPTPHSSNLRLYARWPSCERHSCLVW